jgi:hypothetical protein
MQFLIAWLQLHLSGEIAVEIAVELQLPYN